MKIFQYITILLFAAVSVFMGCDRTANPIITIHDTIRIPQPVRIIHDTIYRTKNTHIRKAEDVYIGGGKIINVNGDNNNVINQ